MDLRDVHNLLASLNHENRGGKPDEDSTVALLSEFCKTVGNSAAVSVNNPSSLVDAGQNVQHALVESETKDILLGPFQGSDSVMEEYPRRADAKKDIIEALQLTMKAESATMHDAYRDDMMRSLAYNKKDPLLQYFESNSETCKEE
ncbi:uncharacterized protein PITG_20217 [Phytophthora infestans T30-4]|uniref:Uncharacterized protein n=1 Tax=Phytophthora infestans (strain T30-4) TaxID=403677 RepID=D0P1J0_PHYIT|nr:uncharacterized protein PITG_20217 [Phytophthora infestans T30-4]EEY54613.1 hypothetical protein PITG_20217 [Phytophthora infestans T30-4]|eukprot:XP_002895850.1 hypothetical protein PITG_20217 [Phytophthora infestans T30-4]